MLLLSGLLAVALPGDAPPPDTAPVQAPFGSIVVAQQYRDAAYAEGMAARAAARKLLRLRGICLTITDARRAPSPWGTTTADGWPIYPWHFGPGGPPSYILRHEIGHDLFARYLIPSTKLGQYGTDAPDWLDEMAAIAFEGAAQQRVRRAEAADLARTGRLPSLRDYLAMTHPELNATRSADGASQAATSQKTAGFYAMSRAFYDFLVARTGKPDIVVEPARAFRQGQDLQIWLLKRMNQPSDGSGLDRLDAALGEWMSEDARYRLGLTPGTIVSVAADPKPQRHLTGRCRIDPRLRHYSFSRAGMKP